MTDIEEDELERMSGPWHEPSAISATAFNQPIRNLFLKPAISVDVGQTVGDAVSLMRKHGFGAVIVTRQSKLAGIITERDLLTKIIGVVSDFEHLSVTKAMTPDPVALRGEDPIVYVMHNMQVGGYRHVPIVDENEVPVSIVSIKDVIGFILGFFQKEIMNISSVPSGAPPPNAAPQRTKG